MSGGLLLLLLGLHWHGWPQYNNDRGHCLGGRLLEKGPPVPLRRTAISLVERVMDVVVTMLHACILKPGIKQFDVTVCLLLKIYIVKISFPRNRKNKDLFCS